MTTKEKRRIQAGLTCRRKVAYPDRAAADEALRLMLAAPGVPGCEKGRLRVYPCPAGHHYHVGKAWAGT